MMLIKEEKIGVTRIILRQPKLGSLAVFSDFLEANRMLGAWLSNVEGAAVCNFEITYADGRRLCGEYNQRLRGRGQPSLNCFILRCNLVSSAFLRVYELAASPNAGRKTRSGTPRKTVALGAKVPMRNA